MILTFDNYNKCIDHKKQLSQPQNLEFDILYIMMLILVDIEIGCISEVLRAEYSGMEKLL